MIRTLTPILSVIIAVILFIFFTQTQLDEIKSLQKQTASYVTATEKYNEFRAILQQKLSIKNNRSTYDNERLDILAPVLLDSTLILINLEKIAKTHNLLLGNVTVKGEDVLVSNTDNEVAFENSELQTVDISFEIIGSYDQFKSFLRDLEKSLSLFEVTEIKYTVTEDGPFQQFALTVRSFALPALQ